jgi:tetratricopeptide (TPR) repeat protein
VPPSDITPDTTLAEAHAHWRAGRPDEAELACKRVLAASPGQRDAVHLMGLIAYARGEFELGLSHLRQACASPDAPATYFGNLARMCRERGLWAEGERAARQAVALDPSLAQAWNTLALILIASGNLAEGRACLTHVLTLSPDNVQALNNLGSICQRSGAADEAERHWMRALELQPCAVDVYCNLADLLVEREEFDRAYALARKAVDLNARLERPYLILARISIARDRYPEAQHWLRELHGFAPEHVPGLILFAASLLATDDLQVAERAARRAVAVAPRDPNARNALGAVLKARDQPQAALAEFDLAAGFGGVTRERSLLHRAALHQECGDQAKARQEFEAVLAEYPDCVTAILNLVSMGGNDEQQHLVDRMQALLQPERRIAVHDRALLHFGLGRTFMARGDAATAFEYLNAGNRLKRATVAYDPDATSQTMREIAAAFSPERLVGGAGNASTMPIFVVGMPRSGSTLVEQILASHPAVHGGGESQALQILTNRLVPSPAAASLTPAQEAELGGAYLAKLSSRFGKQRFVVDKLLSNFMRIGLIRRILPEARIIHCRRDPVDSCLSCYAMLFATAHDFTYDQTELGRYYRDYEFLMDHWRRGLPSTHFLEIDYETVVDDMPGQSRRMLEFLGLPWDDAVLDFNSTTRQVRTASVNQVRRPIYRSSVGKWRAYAEYLKPLLSALGVAG